MERNERTARISAYPPDEFVEQESFMTASEIRELAGRAGIGAGVSVLDLCCGVAGPGRLIARELGCSYLGVDLSARAVETARTRARGLSCRFEVARIPPVPRGPFDVVLLLETMLAFREKEPLLREIAGALPAGGRFAFTLEEGAPLAASEREHMPGADTVWLTPLGEMLELLEQVGLAVIWQEDHSESHRVVAEALAEAFAAHRVRDDLVASHRVWSDWLRSRRVRKLAFVATKVDQHRPDGRRHGLSARPSSETKRSTAMLPPERITPTRRPRTSTRPDIAAPSAMEPLGSMTSF
jgi:SAM-dependent methyltransferase